MPDEIVILFVGPFSWFGASDAPAVYGADEVRQCGIYLWTVPLLEGYLIYYVGETGSSFKARLREHYRRHTAARYHVYSAQEFAHGKKLCLWPGRYDPTNIKTDEECRDNCQRLTQPIQEMAALLRFFLAPMSCDKRIRRRIEATIAQTLYAAPGVIGAFQDKDILYKSRMKAEQPISCVVRSPLPLLGVPERFFA
jgi:hypothetical protein